MMQNRLMLYAATLLMVISFGFSSVIQAETAVAVDQEELMVVRDILNQPNAQPEDSNHQANITQATTPNIANDMAEGQLERHLPQFNQPIIDQANLLSSTDKQAISQRILNIHQQEKGQIGVVIVPTTGQEPIFDYAMRVGQAWQLGSAQRDNGLLMVVAVNDRRIQMLTGYGLEGVLPDIMLSRIIHDRITPYFKQGQYAQGIDAGIIEIDRILNLDPEIAAQAAQDLKDRQEKAYQSEKARQGTMSTLLVILIAGVFGSLFFGRKISAATAAVAGITAGIVNGMGILWSLVIGLGIFFLIITTIAQVILQAILSGSGGGRGGSGGFGGGGGFSGGGGSFGGGGASGSW